MWKLLNDQLLARYSAWANKAEAFARIAGTEKLLAETDPERNERMVGNEERVSMCPCIKYQ
jgi:hypothetical protein